MTHSDDLPIGAKAKVIAALSSKGWVSLRQMARLAGLHYLTILDARRMGRLRAIKVGGRFRVYEDEIIRFLTEGNYVGAHTIQALQEEDFHK